MSTIEKLEKMIAGLQGLLVFLKTQPQLAERLYIWGEAFSIWAYGPGIDEKKEFRRLVKMLSSGARKLPKEHSNSYVAVTRKFGMDCNVSLQVCVSREAVCKKVVTGTKEIPEQLIPARTEEIVEWICK